MIISDRIRLLLKYKNISAAQFADEIDVQRSGISHIISGRNKPSLEFVQKVLNTYKEIRSEWLISGKGPMTKEPELFESDINEQEKDPNNSFQKSDNGRAPNYVQEKSSEKNRPNDDEINPKENQDKNFAKDFDTPETLENANNKMNYKKNSKSIKRIIILFDDNSYEEFLP